MRRKWSRLIEAQRQESIRARAARVGRNCGVTGPGDSLHRELGTHPHLWAWVIRVTVVA